MIKLQVAHITVRLAEKAESWDDEDSTLDNADGVLLHADGTLDRKPAFSPQVHVHVHHATVSETKKIGFVAPRTIDAFVETEEEVCERVML